MNRSRLYTVILVIFSMNVAFGLQTRTDDATAQNRFSSGFPNSPVENNSVDFLLNGNDLSGLGWDTNTTNKGFALISPLHFVAAAHYAPNSSDTITFNNRDGVLKTYGVASVTNMKNADDSNSDLVIGTLESAIPESDNIGFFPVADLGTEALYTGRELYVYGRTPKVGTGTIGTFQNIGSDPITSGSGINTSRTYEFAYLNSAGNNNDAYFEVGDSGSPSFIMVNDQLALTGTHSALITAGLSRLNYDTFIPNYLDNINTAMLGSGYQVLTVPEPNTWALLAGSGILFVCLIRRNYSRKASHPI